MPCVALAISDIDKQAVGAGNLWSGKLQFSARICLHGHKHQVGHILGVTTLGLDAEAIDALPDAGSIKKMRDREFDAVIAKLDIKKLNPARHHTSFDWASLEKAARENEDARRLLTSISNTLKSGRISR